MGNRCTIDSVQWDVLELCTNAIGTLQPKKVTSCETILVDIPTIWRKSLGAVSIYVGEGGSGT